MSSSTILAGIKISAVITMGTATSGALIGRGRGTAILTAMRPDSVTMILEGAVPTAVLALAVQAVFDFSEGFCTGAFTVKLTKTGVGVWSNRLRKTARP